MFSNSKYTIALFATLTLMSFDGATETDQPEARCEPPASGDSHFDICFEIDPPRSTNAKIQLDPTDGFTKIHYLTGRKIVTGDFGDFGGGPYETDDPGWVVAAGHLVEGEQMLYRILNPLQFWSIEQGDWLSSTPNNEAIRIFGVIPLEIILNGSEEEIAFYGSGTVISSNGVSGPTSLILDRADESGAVHSHVDFCLQDGASNCALNKRDYDSSVRHGNPAVGAYMFEMQVFSDVTVNSGDYKYQASDPFIIVLNQGLAATELNKAIAKLTTAPEVEDERVEGAAGILIMSGN